MAVVEGRNKSHLSRLCVALAVIIHLVKTSKRDRIMTMVNNSERETNVEVTVHA